jgi:4-hydroxy-3-polyprenylbenzoate decarboxylase
MPGWYHSPRSLDDLVDFVVARICDQLGLESTLAPRWGSEDPAGAPSPGGS